MHFFPEALEKYAGNHTSPAPAVLDLLERETFAKMYMPQMVSGHVQGRFLSLISKIVQPQTVLDIGTFTGYSAICLSEGLKAGGTVYTIDANEELETMVRSFMEKAGVTGKVKYSIGNAVDIIPQLPGNFDLVFIDADKENYSTYYNLVIDRVPRGGVILADNVLWSGKVAEDPKDAETQALAGFSNMVQAMIVLKTYC